MSAQVLYCLKALVTVLCIIGINSQLLEFYENQSPFSKESFNPSINRAIKSNKLIPTADYWGGSTKSAYSPSTPSVYGHQNQEPRTYRQPKHYSDSSRHPSENLFKRPVKPTYQPREPTYKAYYEDYQHDRQVTLSKLKHEAYPDQEVSYQDHRKPNYDLYSTTRLPARESYPTNKAPLKYKQEDYGREKPYSNDNGYSYNETRLYCNPEAPPACFDYRFGMCVQDESYPEDDIRVALEQFMVKNRLPDPLVVLHDEPTTPTPAHLLIPDEPLPNVCPSSSVRITPIRVKNTDGRWRVIVQRYGEVVQREGIVVCERPDAQCYGPDGRQEVRLVSPLARSCFRYYCSQLKAVKRYLAFDPCNPRRGLFVDSFPMPSACSCRLSRIIC